jgi:hypothetical protein
MDGRTMGRYKQQIEKGRVMRESTMRIAIAAVAALCATGPVEAIDLSNQLRGASSQQFGLSQPAVRDELRKQQQQIQQQQQGCGKCSVHNDMLDKFLGTPSPPVTASGSYTPPPAKPAVSGDNMRNSNFNGTGSTSANARGTTTGGNPWRQDGSWWTGSTSDTDSGQVTYKKRKSAQARHKKIKYE